MPSSCTVRFESPGLIVPILGSRLVPELRKKGYERASATSLISASGTIGVVILPLVPMIIYAVIMQVIATSAVLIWSLSSWQVPSAIASAVLSFSTEPYVIMLQLVVVILPGRRVHRDGKRPDHSHAGNVATDYPYRHRPNSLRKRYASFDNAGHRGSRSGNAGRLHHLHL